MMGVTILKKPVPTPSIGEIQAKALQHPLIKKLLDDGFSIVAWHPYLYADGDLQFLRLRLKNPKTGDKQIRPVTFENGQVQIKEPDYKTSGFVKGKPLYCLPHIAHFPKSTIYLCEGENVADALNEFFKKHGCLGKYVATTSGSASSAKGADFSPLAGRKVICWADNDEPGVGYINDVTQKVIGLGCKVEWVDIDKLGLPEGGDAVDWLTLNPKVDINNLLKLEKIAPPVSGPVKPLFDIADAKIGKFLHSPPPTRRYLLTKCMPAGKVVMLVAAGGTGKSKLALQFQVALATGLPLCGLWPVGEIGCSLGLYAEEDEEELHRRLHHIAAAMKPEQRKQIEQCVYVKSMTGMGMDLQLVSKHGSEAELTETVDRLILTAKQIPDLKLIVLDPVSRFRGGDENSAPDNTRLVEACERIAMETGATVLILHHSSKAAMNEKEASQSASRGSSALTDGVRWQMNLATMSKDEAKTYGVPHDMRRFYMKAVVTKNNYAPPQTGEIWLETAGEHGILQYVEMESPTDQAQAKNLDLLVKKVKADADHCIEHSKTGFAKEYAGTEGIFEIGDKGLRNLIDVAIEQGKLVLAPPKQPMKNVLQILAIPEPKTVPVSPEEMKKYASML